MTLPSLRAVFRALPAWLALVPMLWVGTDCAQFLAPPEAPATVTCCCGPHGVENGCACTGPCCAHGAPNAPGAGPWLDGHCGARQAAAAAPPTLLPATLAGVRFARPAVAAVAAARDGFPRPASPASAPPEPPPRRASR